MVTHGARARHAPVGGEPALPRRGRSARGGALVSIVDKQHDRELLRPGQAGNELRVYEEYPSTRTSARALAPAAQGPVTGSGAGPAAVRGEHGPLGERLVVTGAVDGISYEQTVTLRDGTDRIDFRTRIVDHQAADRLVRVRFPSTCPAPCRSAKSPTPSSAAVSPCPRWTSPTRHGPSTTPPTPGSDSAGPRRYA
ncbi:glycoside hydrolase family 38 C-terminal domain-containing protein [Streptacidiphilus monticola]